MDHKPDIWIEEPGIVCIDFGPDCDVTFESVKYAHEEHKRLRPGRSPVLLYVQTVAAADYDAQEFASDPAVNEIVSAMAIVVQSFFARTLADLFLTFHKPSYPTRMFRDDQSAREWLKQFVEQGRQAPE